MDSLHNTLIIDAFIGGILTKLASSADELRSSPIVADFTPCSKYVAIALNKKISFWEWETNKEIPIEQHHPKHINALKLNTEYCMVASACQNVIIWTPDIPTDKMED